jgi:hypothetical protein
MSTTMAEDERTVNGHSSPRECDVCGKVVKGGGGLYSHLVLAHGVRRPNAETRYRQENERLLAEVGWKDTEIGNLKGQVATLEQETTRLKRFTFDHSCLACGFDLEIGHSREKMELLVKGKRRQGTLFWCEVS